MKKMMPVILAVLMLLSFYMLFSERKKTVDTYNAHLTEARELAGEGVVARSAEAYDAALAIKETFDIRLEKAQMYADNDYVTAAAGEGEDLVNKYPRDPRSYEFLLKQYVTAEKYKDFFENYKKAVKRAGESEAIKALYEQVRYVYNVGYSNLDEVGFVSWNFWTVRDDDLWGYLDSTGHRVINYKYKTVKPFVLSTAAVQEPDESWYYIDSKGEKTAAPTVEGTITDLGVYDTLTAIAVNDSYGYYNKKFEYQFGEYDFAGPFSCGLAPVREGNIWSIINSKGEKLTSSSLQNVVLDDKDVAFRNDRAFVMLDGGYVMIDSDCGKVGTEVFADAKPFLSEGPAAVKLGAKWGFVNTAGEIVIESAYDEARSFKNGFAAVRKGQKWGFINMDGDVCIECLFDEVRDMSDIGVTFVKDGEEWNSLTVYSLYY